MPERAVVTADRSALGDTDTVTTHDLRTLAREIDGPRVSIHLPTHRRGAEVRQDPIQLRNLIDEAAHRLADAGHGDATDALLAPARRLLDDGDFWQHQSDGLAIFTGAGIAHRWRVPIPLAPSVTVADTFHVAPLAPLLSGDGEFLVLAVSQNTVRLFEATRSTMRQLDTGSMPTSMAEALEHEDPERHLEVRSVGSGDAMYHGHGVGEDEKGAVERFLRAVDHGLHDELGADRRPLVLACVAYYVPIFRSVTKHADVVDPAVEGNPDRSKPAELHAAAWACVGPRFAADGERAWGRYQEALGTGAATENLADTAARAVEGRVDTLFVATPPANGDSAPHPDGLLDTTVLATLSASGRVLAMRAADLPDGQPAVALLRY